MKNESLIREWIKLVFVLFLVVLLMLVSGFRYEVGTDYSSYVDLYSYLGAGHDHWGGIEPGFRWVVIQLYNISNDPRVFFLFFSVLTVLFFSLAFYLYSPSVLFSLFVFVALYHYFNSFNLVRQYFAVSVVFLFGTRYLVSRSFIRYALVVFVASLFHVSSLFMLPLYFYLVRRWSSGFYLFLFSVFMLFLVSYPYVYKILFSALGGYEGYADYKGGSANIFLITAFLIVLVPVAYKNKIESLGRVELVSLNASFIAILLALVSYHNVLFFRASMYLSVYFSLLVPVYFSVVRGNLAKYLIGVGVVFVLVVNMLFHLHYNVADVLPLRFGW